MKQVFTILIFSTVSFVAGILFMIVYDNSAIQARSVKNTAVAVSIPEVSPTKTSEVETQEIKQEFESGLLIDEYITDFNGTKLPLDYPENVSKENLSTYIETAKVLPLKTQGFIVGFGDKIYKFGNKLQVVWKYKTAQQVIAFAFVETTNLIYGTAGDNAMFILDAETGKELHTYGRNGRAAYGIVQKFGKDTAIVMDNFSMYREGDRNINYASMNDGISLWHNTKEIWHQDFPPDAELVVNDKRILAITKTTAGIYIKEIFAPRKQN